MQLKAANELDCLFGLKSGLLCFQELWLLLGSMSLSMLSEMTHNMLPQALILQGSMKHALSSALPTSL